MLSIIEIAKYLVVFLISAIISDALFTGGKGWAKIRIIHGNRFVKKREAFLMFISVPFVTGLLLAFLDQYLTELIMRYNPFAVSVFSLALAMIYLNLKYYTR